MIQNLYTHNGEPCVVVVRKSLAVFMKNNQLNEAEVNSWIRNLGCDYAVVLNNIEILFIKKIEECEVLF